MPDSNAQEGPNTFLLETVERGDVISDWLMVKQSQFCFFVGLEEFPPLIPDIVFDEVRMIQTNRSEM